MGNSNIGQKDKEKSIRDTIEAFNARLRPLTQLSEQITATINASFEPIRQRIERFEGWNKALAEKLKSTLEVIQKVQENNKLGKQTRGEIITDVINLDETLEKIILKKYIKGDFQEEFETNMLSDE